MSAFSAPKITPPTNFFPGQMREAGQQLQKAGLIGHRVQALVQGQIDDAKVDEHGRRYSDWLRSVLKGKADGFLYRPAKDIIAGFDATVKAIDDQRQVFAEGLENDYQRREFDARAGRERDRALEIVHGAYAKAAHENAITERGLTVDSSIENAIRLGDDDDDEAMWQEAVNAGEAFIQATGYGPQEAEVYRRGVLARLYAGRVGVAIEAKDFDKAQAVFERGKAAKAFTVEQEAQVSGLLQGHREQSDAYAAADKARADFPGNLVKQLEALDKAPAHVRARAQEHVATRDRIDDSERAEARTAAVNDALDWVALNPGKPLPPGFDYALKTTGGSLDFEARNAQRGTVITTKTGWAALDEAYADPGAWASRFHSPAEIRETYGYDMPASSVEDLLRVWSSVREAKQKGQAEAAKAELKARTTTVKAEVKHLSENVLRLGVDIAPSAYGDQAEAIEAYQNDLNFRNEKLAAWLEAKANEETKKGHVVTRDMLEGFVREHADGMVVPTPFGMQWFPSYMLTPADYANPSTGMLSLKTEGGDRVMIDPLTKQDFPGLQDKSVAELVDMANKSQDDALAFTALPALGPSKESFTAGYDPVTGEPMGRVTVVVEGVTSPVGASAQAAATLKQIDDFNAEVKAARQETKAILAAIRQARLREMHRAYLDEVVRFTGLRTQAEASLVFPAPEYDPRLGSRSEFNAIAKAFAADQRGRKARAAWTSDDIVRLAKQSVLQKFSNYQQAYRFDPTTLDEAFGIISPQEAKKRRRVQAMLSEATIRAAGF